MRHTITLLIILLVSNSFAQTSSDRELFIQALANDDPGLVQYVSNNEILLSERLGITYYDSPNKFLINYGLPDGIKETIKSGSSNYQLSSVFTGDGYEALRLDVPSKFFNKIFYFKDDKYISPLTFHTRKYIEKESIYFRFLIDDTTYFNDYSIKKLDEYVDEMMNLMDFTSAEREILINEKFLYILCKNEDEIEDVTGYASRGIYIVAYDAIVSVYNCHYHEVAHALMNYKLKTDIKPELLFFLEGFAVATGGRGGEHKWVNMELGNFLLASRFINYESIFSNVEFVNEDASISYNVSGFCNKYLLDSKNFNQYLEFYKKYSGTQDELGKISSKDLNFIDKIELDKYITEYELNKPVMVNYPAINAPIINSKEGIAAIYGDDRYYHFKIKTPIFLSGDEVMNGYISKKYEELFDGRDYQGEKYYITATEDEVKVYNLFTNEMLCLYSKGFSVSGEYVKQSDGYFVFYIRKDVFDEDLSGLKIIN